MTVENPVVVGKAYDLYLWVSERTARFPRSRKYTLGDRLENTVLDILLILVEARYEPATRQAILKTANLELEKARFLIRAAHDLKFISVDQYGFVSERINEVGRLVGGWRKTAGPERRRRSIFGAPNLPDAKTVILE